MSEHHHEHHYERHYENHYKDALNPQPGDLKVNLLAELRTYLKSSKLGGPDVKSPEGFSDEALYQKCTQATQLIQEEWSKCKIIPSDKQAVTQFYINTQLYCFELIGLELDAPQNRQNQLKEFADFLKKNQKLKGCDYGSGIGTLGLYLNRNGIACDFADVSAINLGFIAQRLKERGLQGPKLINLIHQEIPAGEYDFITAFDVLEHVTDPVELVQAISSKLKPNGYFIFNLLYHNEEGTPHLLRDPNLIRKNIRSFGLRKDSQFGEFKVYQKVDRPPVLNSLVRVADSLFWDFREKVRSLRGPGHKNNFLIDRN